MISSQQLQTTILACWLLFALYWLANSFTTKKNKEEPTGFASYINKVLLIAAALLIGSFFQIDQALGLTQLIVPRSPLLTILTLALVIVGLGIAIWARRILAKNWSANVTLKENHELITSGPYKYVRHPIYTGILAMLLGTTLSIGTTGAVIGMCLAIASIWIKLRLEEDLMTRHFKNKYTSYRETTKAIVPGVI